MSLICHVTNTGPLSTTMSEMDLDMSCPSGSFGRLHLPSIITKSTGTTITVTDQLIKITNMTAFKGFVKSLTQDESLVFRLENGHATIKGFLLYAKITYSKDVQLKGMNGPRTEMVSTEVKGKGFVNRMKTWNPSPVEMDVGTVKQDVRNGKGETIAEQKGVVYYTRGETEYAMEGTLTGLLPDGESRIVGVGAEEDNWNNETIPFHDTPMNLTDEFVALCKRNSEALSQPGSSNEQHQS